MKDKKLIVLYILMLVVGVALLFTKTTNDVEPKTTGGEVKTVEVRNEPSVKLEKITIAVAKRDIEKHTILTASDYFFKTIEVNPKDADKNRYVSNASQINGYVTKNNIQAETPFEQSFIASPLTPEFISLALKPGHFMYPFKLNMADSYLFQNLQSGDLVDIYVFYGEEVKSNRSGNADGQYVSPSRAFIDNQLKPIVVGKKVLILEPNAGKSSERDVGQIQVELSNQEIKLVSTLMSNAKVFLYPSDFSGDIKDGLQLLGDKEKMWPLTEKSIFSSVQINKLRGNY